MSGALILVSGMPAVGKSYLAARLGGLLCMPMFSKDSVKELLYDALGFTSREEKNRLGVAATDMICFAAERLLVVGQSVILESNFEHASRPGLERLIDKTECALLTIALDGDPCVVYERYVRREGSSERHRGHVVNTRYPEDKDAPPAPPHSFEAFMSGVEARGMCRFAMPGEVISVDCTDFARVRVDQITAYVRAFLARQGIRCGGSNNT